MKHAYVVTGEEVRFTLAEFIAHRLHLDRATAISYIVRGSVYLNKKRMLLPEADLQPGNRITMYLPSTQLPHVADPVLAYRDDHLVIIDKPAGLPSIATRHGGIKTVEDFLRNQFGADAKLLHRLDQDASGLLLISLKPSTRQSLARQVQEHTMQRYYLAIAAGNPSNPQLVIRSRLSIQHQQTRSTSDPRGRFAETRVRVLRHLSNRSLVQVEIKTGRTHQIRAHLAEQGFPLLGDKRYAGPAAERLALHAHFLKIHHPNGQMLELHSPLPLAMRQML